MNNAISPTIPSEALVIEIAGRTGEEPTEHGGAIVDTETSESALERAVKRGGTYDYATHGWVEVTGIWRGVRRIDTAHRADETDVVVVCYSPVENGNSSAELADALEAFVAVSAAPVTLNTIS